MTPYAVEYPFIHFKGNSGYSCNGDTVFMFVDRIDNLSSTGLMSGNLALQLWACQSPYRGGCLAGWKLAEYPLGILQPNHFLAPVKCDVPVNYPESGDYAIVLVVAEWDGEDFNLIHDFQNYSNRDVFLHPRLDGMVGYRCIGDDRLVLDVERIHNPRDSNNLSGTLSLELWALAEPYYAGDFAGHALAGVTLGTLAGGASWGDSAYDLEISPPQAGTYSLVLMLREWVGNGYVTRDHSNFRYQVTFPLVTTRYQADETVITDKAAGEVLNDAPFPEPAAEVAAAGRVGGAGHETSSPPPKDIEQTQATQESESNSFVAVVANLKSFVKWVLDRIK